MEEVGPFLAGLEGAKREVGQGLSEHRQIRSMGLAEIMRTGVLNTRSPQSRPPRCRKAEAVLSAQASWRSGPAHRRQEARAAEDREPGPGIASAGAAASGGKESVGARPLQGRQTLPARPARRRFRYERCHQAIAQEAALDGLYVLWTPVPAELLSTEQTVEAYKSLAGVERAFASLPGESLERGSQSHFSGPGSISQVLW